MQQAPSPIVFESLYTQCHAKLLRYAAQRIDSIFDAQDIVSDVWTVAWQHWSAGEHITLAWLYGTTSHKVIDHYRKSACLRCLYRTLYGFPPDEPLDSSEAQQEIARLYTAILTLSDREQQVLYLVYWENLSAEVAASRVGCSTATLWKVASRIRAKLRTALRPEQRELAPTQLAR